MHSDLIALLAATPELRAEIDAAVVHGLKAIAAPEPMRASEWAEKYFYLSAESSYVERTWKCWPFQRAILDCMGHDDIVSVTLKKSVRVGYTKMLLASLGYFAEHKRRNQIVYQPTDSDAKDWVLSELNTMLRDVAVMARVFPSYKRRSKDNTLRTKSFLGCMLHIRGGTAAGNYRRMTADVVMLDELSKFDRDIENDGSPCKLSFSRLQGATFPKHIKGSTPRLAGLDLVDDEFDAAERRFFFHVPCPNCQSEQPLEWGGRDHLTGFKWSKADAGSVVHMCASCGIGFTQAQYLAVWESGRWKTSEGIWIDPDGRFITAAGFELPPPFSVAFHIWTAYSPQATWASIVTEYIEALRLKKSGDHAALKTWTNSTLGLSYKVDGEKTEASALVERAKLETYRLRLVPMRGLVLVCGVDVQDNRFHILVWAFGRDDESWLVDRRVIYCDPGEWKSWVALDTYLSTRFPHEGGQACAIDAVGIDIGGHFTHHVYRYVMLREARRVHAVHGSSIDGKLIVAGAPSKQDVNVDGQVVKEGVKLWRVGTDTAKDLLFGRLRTAQPGAGYVHISGEVEAEFFDQLTAEMRVEQKTSRGMVSRWVKRKPNARNEDLDCTVYALFCVARMNLQKYTDAEWRRLEQVLCPTTADMFVNIEAQLPLPAPVEPTANSPAPPLSPAEETSASTPVTVADALMWSAPRARRVRGVSA